MKTPIGSFGGGPAARGRPDVRALPRSLVLWIAVLLLAVALRTIRLGEVPPHNANADEYAWTWAGMTLVGNGWPVGWSSLPAYPKVTGLTWRGHYYPMVSPWLDHPPAYQVLLGVWMKAGGYADILAVDLWFMRVSSVVLTALQFLVFAALARRVFPEDPERPLLAVLLLAIAAPAVVLHRLVVSEALWVPVALASYLVLLTPTLPPRRRLGLLAVLAFLLPMTKLAALPFLGGIVVLCLRQKAVASAVALASGVALGLLALLAYGVTMDKAAFFAALDAQGNRFSGFGSLYALLFSPRGEIVGPYLPFALGAVLCLVKAAREESEWALLVPLYAASMALLANQNEVYAWYGLPLYPLYCLALADLIATALRSDDARGLWVWLLFCLVEVAGAAARSWPGALGGLRSGLAVLLALALLAFLLRLRAPAPGVRRLAVSASLVLLAGEAVLHTLQ